MASDEATIKRIARETAREIIAELQNEHGLITLPEAQQLAQIENEGQLWCASCGYELSLVDAEQKGCPHCGGTKATTTSLYECEKCGASVDPKWPQCRECGHPRAIPRSNAQLVKGNPAPYYTCAECLEPVAISQPRCNSCGSTRAYRTVTR